MLVKVSHLKAFKAMGFREEWSTFQFTPVTRYQHSLINHLSGLASALVVQYIGYSRNTIV